MGDVRDCRQDEVIPVCRIRPSVWHNSPVLSLKDDFIDRHVNVAETAFARDSIFGHVSVLFRITRVLERKELGLLVFFLYHKACLYLNCLAFLDFPQ